MKLRSVVVFCCVVFGLALSQVSSAQARDTYYFEIIAGDVTVEASYCLPGSCVTRTALLSGTFSAFLPGGASQIFFPSSNLSTDPDLGFVLPSNPDEDSGGTVREIDFAFDGTLLKVDGSINQSAFDGPVTTYNFAARVTAKPPVEAAYFTARPDFRKCVSPLCGGYFVKAVNVGATRCADGTLQKECYVKEIRTRGGVASHASSFSNQTPLFVVGEIVPEASKPFGTLGVFNAKFVQYSATDKTAAGRFYGVSNNGIMCITTPCFSYDEDVLNTKKESTLSRINFDKSGASERDIEVARRLMAAGETVYASGVNKKYRGFAGTGVELVVNQFYLPKFDRVSCEEGYSFFDNECRTPYGCAYPLIELTGIGGAAMVDPITGEVTVNETKNCVKACEFPAEPNGPGQCIVYYP